MNIDRRGLLASVPALVGMGVPASATYEDERVLDLEGIGNSPTIVDGTLYVTDETTLLAVDIDSRDVLWTTQLGETVPGSAPAVVDGICYVTGVDDTGVVIALEADSGAEVWRRAVGGPPVTPSVWNGRCYVQGEDGIVSLDAYTGELEWETTAVEGSIGSKMNVLEGHCYANTAAETVCLDAHDGEIVWRVPEGGFAEELPSTRTVEVSVPTSPVVHEDKLYVGTGEGTLLRIHRETGSLLVEKAVAPNGLLNTPTIHDDSLLVPATTPGGGESDAIGDVTNPNLDYHEGFWYSEWSVLYRFSLQPASIELVWATERTAQVMSPPTVASDDTDSDVVFGRYSTWEPQGLTLLDWKTGDSLGGARADPSLAAPVVWEGTAYSCIEDGVIAIDLTTDGSSLDKRVEQGIENHHEGWSDSAGLQVTDIEIRIDEEILEVGEGTSYTIVATSDPDGREHDLTHLLELEVEDSGVLEVQGPGDLRMRADGTSDVTVSFRGERATETLRTPDDDSIPAVGVLGTAAAVGLAAYLSSSIDS